MFRRLVLFSCPLVVIVLLTSCGEPTKREFSQETGLRERIDAFAAEFEALAADFPYEGKPFALATPLAEPLSPANSLTVSIQELGSPMLSRLTTEDKLILNTNYGMGRLLQSSFASEPMEEDWTERVEAILIKRYLFIYWTHSYKPPLVVDGKSYYKDGTAKADGTLYDRETENYLLRFQTEGVAAGFVEAKAEKWKLNQNLVFEINQLLRQDLLQKMSAEFEKQTGAILYRNEPGDAPEADSVDQ
ncbi:hypothetical protein N9B73_03350 [Verrucomicrobiales bacterium]|jgi:hypothetical protein|nr:hypothetical protein [Verrucomicrobiales bacterium]